MIPPLNNLSAFEIKRYLEATKKIKEAEKEELLKILNKKKEEQDEAFVNWDEYI